MVGVSTDSNGTHADLDIMDDMEIDMELTSDFIGSVVVLDPVQYENMISLSIVNTLLLSLLIGCVLAKGHFARW